MKINESRVNEAIDILNAELVEVEDICLALKVTPQCVCRWVKQKQFPEGSVFEKGSFRRYDLAKILKAWGQHYDKTRRPQKVR